MSNYAGFRCMTEVALVTTGNLIRANLQSPPPPPPAAAASQHLYFTGRMDFLWQSQQCQSTEGKIVIIKLGGLCSVHSLEMQINRRRRTTSSAWINIGNDKGSSSWVRRQSTQTCCHIPT